jgi:hypothetical protein
MKTDLSYRTAIKRTKLSIPTKFLIDSSRINGRVLDYGCGRGFDADYFGWDKYDPYYNPVSIFGPYDTIVCNYVLNVIPNESDRTATLTTIKNLLCDGGAAYITVRREKNKLNGWTKNGTYQTRVELDLPIVKQTNDYCIYEMKK